MKQVLGDKRAILTLVGPALIVYTVVMLVPVMWSLGYTFFDGNAITGFRFTGLDNFTRLWEDTKVLDAFVFTLKYAAVVTVGQVLIGYGLALLYVFVLRRYSATVRTLLFFPIVLPTVAVGLLFQQLFSIAPQTGPVNSFLNVLGFASIDWFGDGGSAFVVIAVMDIWRSMGFYGVLLYAGLVDIPEDVLEAARTDGAGPLRLVRHVVLPLSWPVLVSAVIFSINGTLKVFDSIMALTDGGPGTSTSPLTLYMFQTSFTYGDYGYGSSVALLLTLLCLVVTVFIFRASRRDLTKG